MNYLIIPFQGLGDEIYQRPFVKQLSKEGKVFVKTPWPELYEDIPNVFFVKPNTPLRTQRKNEDFQSLSRWTKVEYPVKKINGGYKPGDQILTELHNRFECDFPNQASFDLPSTKRLMSDDYVVIRPVTIRTERAEVSRNPNPLHVEEIANWLQTQDVKVISVGDVDNVNEKYVTGPISADITLDNGLPIVELLSLVSHAKAVIGGVGWIVPAGIATKVPTYIVCGGRGGCNHPEILTHPCLDTSNIMFSLPDHYCMCKEMQHDCNKYISNSLQKFKDWYLAL